MTTKRRYPWQIKPDTGISQPAVVKAPAIVAQVSRVCLSGHEAAAALGVSFGTLETWRRARSGPPSFTAPDGRRRLYPVDLLVDWARERAEEAADNRLNLSQQR